MQRLIGIILLLSIGCTLQAQKDSTRKPVFKVLPTAYYTPETRIAVEGFAYLSFFTREADRASNARIFAAVTQNRQLTIDLPWQIYTAEENYRVAGKWDLKIFPEYFYGVGNKTKESIREIYTYRSSGIRNRLQRKLMEQNFLGIAIEGRILKAELPLSMVHTVSDTLNIIGVNGYQFAGIGPTYTYDSRDVILCPSDGQFFEATFLYNIGEAANRTIQYGKLMIDFRQYFTLPRQTVVAYQVVGQSSFGDVPYRELPTLGGPLMHRGYYFGRFRDKNMVFSQAEVRKHLFWRLGAAVFASAGRVYENANTQILSGFHPAGGGGLRFKLSKKDEANIRFDVALTPDSRGFYVYFAEAF